MTNNVRLLDGTDDGLGHYGDLPDPLPDLLPDQLSPSREFCGVPPPSVVDVLRQCRPSRELVGLLARESTRASLEGNHDDAATLLALAFCVREVLPR